jgi:hypothetical protein
MRSDFFPNWCCLLSMYAHVDQISIGLLMCVAYTYISHAVSFARYWPIENVQSLSLESKHHIIAFDRASVYPNSSEILVNVSSRRLASLRHRRRFVPTRTLKETSRARVAKSGICYDLRFLTTEVMGYNSQLFNDVIDLPSLLMATPDLIFHCDNLLNLALHT